MVNKSSKRQERMDRQARAEAARRKQQAIERRRRMTMLGSIGVVVVLVATGLFFAYRSGSSAAPASSDQVMPLAIAGGVVTQQKPVAVVPDTSGIEGVVAYDTKGYPSPGTADAGTLEHQHVLGPVSYTVTPPVGGPHNVQWMNCGVYTKAVPNERAVHNLEHGAVWITYRPSLAASDVTTLTDLVLKQALYQGNRFMDLTPWATESLPSPIVITAWGRQLKVDSANDPRLQQFITAFRAKTGITPEVPFPPCDGQPVDIGGQPARS